MCKNTVERAVYVALMESEIKLYICVCVIFNFDYIYKMGNMLVILINMIVLIYLSLQRLCEHKLKYCAT